MATKKPPIIEVFEKKAQIFTDPYTQKPVIEVPLNQFFNKEKSVDDSWPEVVAALEEARSKVGWPENAAEPKDLVSSLHPYFMQEALYLELGLVDKQQLSLLIMPYVADALMWGQGFEGQSVMTPRQPWMLTLTHL